MDGYKKKKRGKNESDGGEKRGLEEDGGEGLVCGHMTRSRLTINCNDYEGKKKKNRKEKRKSTRMSKYTKSIIYPISSVFQWKRLTILAVLPCLNSSMSVVTMQPSLSPTCIV